MVVELDANYLSFLYRLDIIFTCALYHGDLNVVCLCLFFSHGLVPTLSDQFFSFSLLGFHCLRWHDLTSYESHNIYLDPGDTFCSYQYFLY